MGMVVILFNGAEPFEQSVNNPSTEGFKWNLMKISKVVSEKKTFVHHSQEDHDGPISLTWANRFAYLLLKIQSSSLL